MPAHDQTTIAAVILGAGVPVCCLTLPLVYRKIPMNIFYGVRIAEASRIGSVAGMTSTLMEADFSIAGRG
jgi:hypothetical protein